MLAALAGGVGGAKLLLGMSRRMPPEQISVIANTGDDIDLYGLRICPDLDTIAYTLAGRVNPATGWGIGADTFECLRTLGEYGGETWFQLGDRDLATHLFRTHLLATGIGLAEVTTRICKALGVRARLFPMTEAYVPTQVTTGQGELHIQEYLVRYQCRPTVQALRYLNMDGAQPAPGVEDSIRRADALLICPSNPFISIGPILAVPGIRHWVESTSAPVIAVTPIVGGQALKGPAAKMLQELGYPVSAYGVARFYQGIAKIFVLDERDADSRSSIEALGMKVVVANTIMHTLEDKCNLAQTVLEIL